MKWEDGPYFRLGVRRKGKKLKELRAVFQITSEYELEQTV